jgi:hypothetical protein
LNPSQHFTKYLAGHKVHKYGFIVRKNISPPATGYLETLEHGIPHCFLYLFLSMADLW